MNLQSIILTKIKSALQPYDVRLINDSHKHQGHSGDNGSGESHFRLLVVSDLFEGLSRLERQRLIFSILEEEMRSKIHALSLQLITEKEHKKQF